MRYKVSAFFSATVIAFLLLTLSGMAQSAPSARSIVVIVEDDSGKAISGIAVRLVGDAPGLSYVHLTDRAGVASFSDLPIGEFRIIVSEKAFQTYARSVDVSNDHATTVKVTLERLSVIGTVRSRSQSFREQITETSPILKISPNLLSAINQLSAVSTVSGEGGIGFRASVNGEDPSNTAFTLNGTPAGNGAALAINTDLLSSVQADQDLDQLNLNFLGPTTTPQYVGQFMAGSFNNFFEKETAQGSVGFLGFAIAHSGRSVDSELNGQTYRDQSGLSYEHEGGFVSSGNYGKLTAPISTWNVAASLNTANTLTNPIPTYFGGILPAGGGPGELVTGNSSNPVFVANGSLGLLGLSLSAVAWRLHTIDNYESQIVSGQRIPSYVSDFISGTGLDFASNVDVGANTTLNASFSRTLTKVSSTQSFAGASTNPSLAGASSADGTTVFDFTEASTRFRKVQAKLGLQGSAHDGGQVEWQTHANISWTPAVRDSFVLHEIAGSQAVVVGDASGVQPLPHPQLANFDCSAETATITGPGVEFSAPHFVNLSVSDTHRLGSGGSISIRAYDIWAGDIILTDASVSAVRESPSFFPPNYLSEIRSAYNAAGGCDGTLSDQSIFVNQDISGVSAQYKGLDADLSVPVIRNVSASISYAFNSAVLSKEVQELESPLSPYIVGRQLPTLPFSRGNATLDWKNRSLEMIGNVQFVSGNNQRNLRPFSVVNFGFDQSLSKRIDLVGFCSNAFDTLPGRFVSQTYGVPLMTVSGASLQTLGAPLGPTLFYARLVVHIGQDL